MIRSLTDALLPAVVAAGAVFMLSALPTRSARAVLGAGTAPAPGPGYTAWIVVQPEDCESNLSLLGLLARPLVARGIPRVELRLIGGPADTVGLRERLGPDAASLGLGVVSHRSVRPLRFLGFRRTPFLIVLDGEGQVRLAVESPRAAEDFVRLGAVLTALAAPGRPAAATFGMPGTRQVDP